jgi:hypothetical protein
MMTLFMICAVVGGVVMLCQFLLMLAGFDHAHDAGVDHHIELHHGGEDHDQGATWFFHVLSFRAVTAALTFFGLSGLAALSSPLVAPFAILIALTSGALAMVVVAWLMGLLHSLQSEGNVHIESAVGTLGTVYLTIPANKAGAGKVTLKIQNRTMEYRAVTEEEQELKTGTPVMVVGITAPDVVQVVASV